MAVIAITSEMGSLGREVAQAAARQLGLRFIDDEAIHCEVADLMQRPEPSVHNFLEGHPAIAGSEPIDPTTLSRCTVQKLTELATGGNVVIRCLGAPIALGPVGHVLRVRVTAPMADREATVMERRGLKDRAAARREIEASDRACASVVQQLYGTDYADPAHYDIVINTGRLSVDSSGAAIATLAGVPEFKETPETTKRLAEQLLAARLRR